MHSIGLSNFVCQKCSLRLFCVFGLTRTSVFAIGVSLACINCNGDESRQNCPNYFTFSWFSKCEVQGNLLN